MVAPARVWRFKSSPRHFYKEFPPKADHAPYVGHGKSSRLQIKIMKNIFIIPGYGIPKDILKDEPYRKYLGLVFNHIYQICLNKDENKPVIIFCGGNTDIFKPYTRTE